MYSHKLFFHLPHCSSSSVDSSSKAEATLLLAVAAMAGGRQQQQHPKQQEQQQQQEDGDGEWTTQLPPLPLPAAPDADAKEATIFVSIAAYRDPELLPTLHSLFSTARHPERVSVGLVWQGAEGEGMGALPVEWAKRVRTLRMDCGEAAGPCWARHLAQGLWQGERFWLQIDSHMRCRPGWDVYLIHALTQECGPDGGHRAVLTTYPIGYELVPGVEAGAVGPVRVPRDVRPTLLCPSKVCMRERGRGLYMYV